MSRAAPGEAPQAWESEFSVFHRQLHASRCHRHALQKIGVQHPEAARIVV